MLTRANRNAGQNAVNVYAFKIRREPCGPFCGRFRRILFEHVRPEQMRIFLADKKRVQRDLFIAPPRFSCARV